MTSQINVSTPAAAVYHQRLPKTPIFRYRRRGKFNSEIIGQFQLPTKTNYHLTFRFLKKKVITLFVANILPQLVLSLYAFFPIFTCLLLLFHKWPDMG